MKNGEANASLYIGFWRSWGSKMKCPKCNNEQNCPCVNCKDTFSKGKTVYIRVGDDNCKCAFCGFIAHMNWGGNRSL